MDKSTIFDIIRSGDYLILDTETTGLHSGSEICQIAIINSSGAVLLDTLVKPVHPIPAEATAIHGITNEMVADAPMWQYLTVRNLIQNKNVIIYNADYDVTMLYRSTQAVTMTPFEWNYFAKFYCAMETFARIYGDWNARYKSFKWQKLATACAYYGIPITKAHGALEDCLSTLAVCKAMIVKEKTE